MRFLNKIFTIKNVPSVNWSSEFPLNTRPRFITLLMLVIGLFLFGLGEAIIIGSGSGVSPWTVLAQGISSKSGLSIGVATFLISVSILLFWIPLRQIPGIGTVSNAIVVALVLDLILPYLPRFEHTGLQIAQVVLGVFITGFGGAIYLIANLGPGPRDGLMTGLQSLTNFPIASVRVGLEVSVVFVGWLLGGTVGLGTVLFALGIGPSVSTSLFALRFFFQKLGTE